MSLPSRLRPPRNALRGEAPARHFLQIQASLTPRAGQTQARGPRPQGPRRPRSPRGPHPFPIHREKDREEVPRSPQRPLPFPRPGEGARERDPRRRQSQLAPLETSSQCAQRRGSRSTLPPDPGLPNTTRRPNTGQGPTAPGPKEAQEPTRAPPLPDPQREGSGGGPAQPTKAAPLPAPRRGGAREGPEEARK